MIPTELKKLIMELKDRLGHDIRNLKHRTKVQLVDAWLTDLHPQHKSQLMPGMQPYIYVFIFGTDDCV
jgi:hypothetical protein